MAVNDDDDIKINILTFACKLLSYIFRPIKFGIYDTPTEIVNGLWKRSDHFEEFLPTLIRPLNAGQIL